MKKLILLALAIVVSASFSTVSAKGKKNKKAAAAEKALLLATANDSLSYAAGMSLTDGLLPYLKQQFGVDESQLVHVVRGFKEAAANSSDTTFIAYAAGIQVAEMVRSRMLPNLSNDVEGINADLVYAGFAASLEKNHTIYTDSAAKSVFTAGREEANRKKNEAVRLEGEAFLAENKTKPGVITMPDGLQYKVLKQGNGPLPKSTDKVKVIYEGRTLDGNVFDATSKHGKDSDTFGVSGLIKGWTEALLMMPVGSKWELYIPQELAYGERGAGRNIKPYSALIFTLELLGIE